MFDKNNNIKYILEMKQSNILNESELKRMINKTVNNVFKEITYQNNIDTTKIVNCPFKNEIK